MSASVERIAQGRKAKRAGASFEGMFEDACRRVGLACTRFPDGCKRVGPTRIIQVRTPWDWVVTHEGRTALVDTKTNGAARFPHAKIEAHQARELLKHERAGALAGYVIWLRPVDQVIFVPASVLAVAQTKRGSIGVDSDLVVRLGTIGAMDARAMFDALDPDLEGAAAACECRLAYLETMKGNE